MGSLLQKTVYCAVLMTLVVKFAAQDFTCKKGSQSVSQQGNYGNAGISAPSNNPGGRAGCASWQNNGNNNFWVFGGDGYDDVGNPGLLSDLWKYDLTTNEWVWLHGADVIAQPGVYGIKGVPAGSNKPGSRSHSVAWTDNNGKFWLFGGYGYDSVGVLGYLNDLWTYDPSTNQWTWLGGEKDVNQTASYGTKGSSSPLNQPGARVGASGWVSNSGKLYMFGGMGYHDQNNVGALNDLWMFDISVKEWVWIGGSNQLEQSGNYGTIGVADPNNMPGARKNAMSWKDLNGNFWILGGFGRDGSATPAGFLNDLWKYSVSSGEWTWVRGSSSSGVNGVYGSQGVASPANDPGARTEGVTWTDAANTLWLFGGEGYPAAGTGTGKLNDLWKYDMQFNVWTWQKSSSIIDQAGTYGSMGFPGPGNRPGARSQAAGFIDSQSNLYLMGGEGYGSTTLTAGALNDLWKYTNCFISPIQLTITSQDSSICAGETTSLTATGGPNYLWSGNSATTSFIIIKPTTTTTYTVFSGNSNGCVYSASFTQTVSSCAGINDMNTALIPKIFPNPNDGKFILHNANGFQGEFTIYNAVGERVYSRKLGDDEKSQVETGLSPGLYIYSFEIEDRVHSGKFIVR